jgi:hypothetical protein
MPRTGGLREDEFHPAVVSEKMFTCLLPEYENPAVLLDHDCLWWQDDTGHLSSWKVGSLSHDKWSG